MNTFVPLKVDLVFAALTLRSISAKKNPRLPQRFHKNPSIVEWHLHRRQKVFFFSHFNISFKKNRKKFLDPQKSNRNQLILVIPRRGFYFEGAVKGSDFAALFLPRLLPLRPRELLWRWRLKLKVLIKVGTKMSEKSFETFAQNWKMSRCRFIPTRVVPLLLWSKTWVRELFFVDFSVKFWIHYNSLRRGLWKNIFFCDHFIMIFKIKAVEMWLFCGTLLLKWV